MRHPYFSIMARGLTLGLVLVTTSVAADESTARFWRQHQAARAGVLQAWARDDQAALKESVFQLTKAEIYLLAQGAVAPEDPRLVGRLAAEGPALGSSADLPIFAQGLFFQDLEQRIGFRPSLEHLRDGPPFQVRRAGLN